MHRTEYLVRYKEISTEIRQKAQLVERADPTELSSEALSLRYAELLAEIQKLCVDLAELMAHWSTMPPPTAP